MAMRREESHGYEKRGEPWLREERSHEFCISKLKFMGHGVSSCDPLLLILEQFNFKIRIFTITSGIRWFYFRDGIVALALEYCID